MTTGIKNYKKYMKSAKFKYWEEELILSFFASSQQDGRFLLHSETDREKMNKMIAFITKVEDQAYDRGRAEEREQVINEALKAIDEVMKTSPVESFGPWDQQPEVVNLTDKINALKLPIANDY